jgi:hypothetical protein
LIDLVFKSVFVLRQNEGEDKVVGDITAELQTYIDKIRSWGADLSSGGGAKSRDHFDKISEYLKAVRIPNQSLSFLDRTLILFKTAFLITSEKFCNTGTQRVKKDRTQLYAIRRHPSKLLEQRSPGSLQPPTLQIPHRSASQDAGV